MKWEVELLIPLLLCGCINPISLKSEVPEVTYKTPAADETEVAINRRVMVIFSEEMNAASFTSETFILKEGPVTIAGTITCSGDSATFIPARNLIPNTRYAASITTEVTTISGTHLKALQQWNFTTGAIADSVAPSINAIFPAYASDGVALDRKISATFSETVDSLSITLSTFSLHHGTSAVSGTIRCNGPIATFIPADNLAPNAIYRVTVTTRVTDLAGNAMAEDHSWSFTTSDEIAGQSPVLLKSASRFAVLAEIISSVGRTTVSGDLGSYPDSSISGFPDGTITGSVFSGDSVARSACADMGKACADLTARPASSEGLSGDDLGGMTIMPGTYRFSSSLKIDSADLTLNAQGDPNAIFVFQTPTSLVVSTDRKVILGKGARSGNIFWRVESAELGTNSVLKGTILADQSISLHSGAKLDGRALSMGGTVSLDTGTITLPAP
jgi:hypothetical protein